MGDGRDKQARASAGIATDIVAGTFSPAEVVGKHTLTGDPSSPTGDEYIDHHALCTRTVSHDFVTQVLDVASAEDGNL